MLTQVSEIDKFVWVTLKVIEFKFGWSLHTLIGATKVLGASSKNFGESRDKFLTSKIISRVGLIREKVLNEFIAVISNSSLRKEVMSRVKMVFRKNMLPPRYWFFFEKW